MDTFKRIVTAVLICTVMIAGSLAAGTQTVDAASAKVQGTTKTVTKVTTKTTKKSVKMKIAAKKSSVIIKTTKRNSSKVITDSKTKKVTQKKIVETTVKTKLTKKSKIKKVETTVKTTVKTITTTYPKTGKPRAEAVIKEGRNQVTPAVLEAFDQLGFTIKVNRTLDADGTFSTEKHDIELKDVTCGVLLHEMGHFLECLKGHAAETDEFICIYSSEKGKYAGCNKKYVTATEYEYFAESYRDYIEKPDVLKKERPETYEYIDKMAASVTQADVDYMNEEYGLNW